MTCRAYALNARGAMTSLLALAPSHLAHCVKHKQGLIHFSAANPYTQYVPKTHIIARIYKNTQFHLSTYAHILRIGLTENQPDCALNWLKKLILQIVTKAATLLNQLQHTVDVDLYECIYKFLNIETNCDTFQHCQKLN